jgi:hypothetical protein
MNSTTVMALSGQNCYQYAMHSVLLLLLSLQKQYLSMAALELRKMLKSYFIKLNLL